MIDAEQAGPPPSRLARRLGLVDAVSIGLGSMIGAGVFAALAPAARAAGNGLLLGLVLAGLVAYCNAMSSAALAAKYPESGGTYVYGGRRLGAFWGSLAGWCFVGGKLASAAAMALTFATYAVPALARPLAVLAVVASTALNYRGVHKTALVTRGLVVLVLASLGLVVAALGLGGTLEPARLWPLRAPSAHGVLQAAGFLFFAFAGYARIATLGEEVKDPAHTIPRAIPLALGLALLVYAAVYVSALLAVDAAVLAASTAPLASAVQAGGLRELDPVVRVGAAIASLSVLLSLIAAIGRTAFAMASNGDLPSALGAVHPRYRVPHRAELAVGLIVVAVVAVGDIRSSIGFSACLVLVYYAITNAAAWTLLEPPARARRGLAGAGLAGCLVLACSLPAGSMLAGAGVLLLAAGASRLRRRA